MSTGSGTCFCGKPSSVLGYCKDCFAKQDPTIYDESGSGPFAGELRSGMRVVDGRYVLERKLGEGGMGAVWLAFDEQLSAGGAPVAVALKFIGGYPQGHRDLERLLRKEVLASRTLSHPNIVRVHDLHTTPGEPVCYSMEFVEGRDLREELAQTQRGRFTYAELEPIISQLLDALQYAHEVGRLVHRDLKPANLMLCPDGTLKLTDFGLARPDSKGDAYVTTVGGTLLYASPSQRSGGAPCVADDLYSLCAVLYHLLTGHPPYSAEDLARSDTVAPPEPPHPWHYLARQSRRDIPGSVCAALLRGLKWEGGGAAPDIRTFRIWLKTGPPVDSAIDREAHWLRRLADVLVTLLLLFGLLMLLVGIVWNRGGDEFLRTRWPVLAPIGEWTGRLWHSVTNPAAIPVPKVEGIRSNAAVLTGEQIVEPPPIRGPAVPLPPRTRLEVSPTGRRAAGEWPGIVELYQLQHGNWTRIFSDLPQPQPSGQWSFTNLESGTYRLEAGTAAQTKNCRDWLVMEFPVTGETVKYVELSRAPAVLRLFSSDPIPFVLYDSWTNAISFLREPKPEPLEPASRQRLLGADVDPIASRFLWELAYPMSQALGGRYTVQVSKEHLDRLGLEMADGSEVVSLQLEAGKTNILFLKSRRWSRPKLGAVWTVKDLKLALAPVGGTGGFLAGVTEVTVGQFREFARTHPAGGPIESVTAEGWRSGARTWENAFDGQTDLHPVVGVSFEEAKGFCTWLTGRERAAGRLGTNQRYRLPTTEHWTHMVGTEEFPWGPTFPPAPEDGNYAGLEVLQKDWPLGWALLTLDSTDPGSARTVPATRGRLNRWGLIGLGGNAAEWCDTWYQMNQHRPFPWAIPSLRLSDDGGGQRYRVVRGASWYDSDRDMLRSEAHWAEEPSIRSARIGFRVVLQEEGNTP